jgi:beta-N-acetylhexosaminidase
MTSPSLRTQARDLPRELLGELIFTGFEGLELGNGTRQFLRDARIGGIILFSKNYENPAQVAELINEAQEARAGELPLWVSVDHEGGRVQRFRKPFTKIPEAADIARKDSPNATFEIAQVIGRELAAVGVNLDFAPVADVNTNPDNPVIGRRAFGDDADGVSKHVTAFVRGLLKEGVQACIKHFPGHGDTNLDSHFALPSITTSLETMRDREWRPFLKAMKSGCNFLMSAHIVCKQIDPEVPATLSKKIMTDLLRGELRYTGVILSDDMEMKAIADPFGAKDAPVRAINAGCDGLLYRSEEAARIAFEGLCEGLESGALDPARVIASAERLRALKRAALPVWKPVVIADLGNRIGTEASAEVAAQFTLS